MVRVKQPSLSTPLVSLNYARSSIFITRKLLIGFFNLTFEGRASEWYYTLPIASIHSFEHLATELFHAFDKYDYKSVFKKIM